MRAFLRKLWCIFKHEYIRRVKTKGFIFAVISMPLLLLLAAGLGVLSMRMQANTQPIGFIDQSGFFKNAVIPEKSFAFASTSIEMIEYSDLETGVSAVEIGEIQAFFAIQQDYISSGEIEVFTLERPGENAFDRIRDYLREELISGQDEKTKIRIESGSDFTIQSLDGAQQTNMRDWFLVFFPFAVSLIFIIVINISGGYLLQSVVDEKENRTMELIMTSVSPDQLMTGKILGNLSVGLTQLFIWFSFAVLWLAGLKVLFNYGQTPQIQTIHLVILFGIILPAFILIAALMTLVSTTATELREAQQVSVLFTLPMVSPSWFAPAILQHPGNPLIAFLSIFPFTAVVTMSMRISVSLVPAWQLILAVIVMWGSATGALLLASRAFRLGMLQYGKRLSLKQIFTMKENGGEDA